MIKEEYSDVASLRPSIHIADIGRECLALQNICGGNAVVFQNILSDKKSYLMGIDEGGIGCVAVHPSRRYFAVGGSGSQPKIYIYSYPSLQIVKILSGGAEKGYATMSFNRTGVKLATVATAPDYMLTIWDWEEEKMGLHSKAFGQDIFSVRFSLDDDYRLTTSGTGHIRFWKIASTFTGLKLQGLIGKFGKVELSDISAFTELPDGKVVSGTEFGSLLLWEGNFIKCRFVLSNNDKSSCHHGDITYVEYDRDEKCIVTAGKDGYIRFWDFTTIDTAEIDSDNSMDLEITPLAEYRVGSGDGIMTMIDSGNEGFTRLFVYKTVMGQIKSCKFDLRSKGSDVKSSLITIVNALTSGPLLKSPINHEAPLSARFQTSSGVLYFQEPLNNTIVSGHVGSITGLDTCPCGPYFASCDSSGNIILWDYKRKKEISRRSFPTSISTCLTWLPISCSSSSIGSSFAIGFEDGTVRVLTISQHATKGIVLSLTWVSKSHDHSITSISFSPQGNHVAISGKDGKIFLFDCKVIKHDIHWKPIRFFSIVPTFNPNNDSNNSSSNNSNNNNNHHHHHHESNRENTYVESMSWSSDNNTILCSCHDKILREANVKDLLSLEDIHVESYETIVPIKEIPIKISDPNYSNTTAATATSNTNTMSKDTTMLSEVIVPGTISTTSSTSAAISVTMTTNNNPVVGQLSLQPSRKSSTDRSSRNSVSGSEIMPYAITPTVLLDTSYAIYTHGRRPGGIITNSYLKSDNHFKHVYEASTTFLDSHGQELSFGLYSKDYGNKEHGKSPSVTCMKYSWTGKLLAQGAEDGSVIIRPSGVLDVFGRNIAHNGIGSNHVGMTGTRVVSVSYDDKYLISGGYDGTVVIQRIRLDILFSDIPSNLSKDIQAGIYDSYENFAKHPKLMYESYVEPSYLRLIRPDESLDEQFPEVQSEQENTSEKIIFSIMPEDLANDIDTKVTYSIQQERLRKGEDVKLSAAEQVKNETRQAINELRKKFDFLRRQNELLPESVRLPREKLMEVDGDYWEILLKEREAMIEEVHKEYAYDIEKSILLRKKINETFMKGIIVEEIKLSAFPSVYTSNNINNDGDNNSNHDNFDISSSSNKKFSETLLPYVLSLRTQALDKSVVDILEFVRNQEKVMLGVSIDGNTHYTHSSNNNSNTNPADSLMNELSNNGFNDTTNSVPNNTNRLLLLNSLTQGVDGKESSSMTMMMSLQQINANPNMNMNQSGNLTNAQTGQLRRELRKQRLENLKSHELKKPKEDEDDVRDIEAIIQAEKTLGNYKLKYGDDYEITEELRINAPKKRIQMALLEEKMVKIRLQFNEKFLKLRQLKYNTINEVQSYNRRIREINRLLEEDHLNSDLLFDLQHNPTEYPDDRDEVTMDELNEYRKRRGGIHTNNNSNKKNINEKNVVAWDDVIPPTHSIITGTKTVIEKDENTGNYILSRPESKPIDLDSLRDLDYKIASNPTADMNVNANGNIIGGEELEKKKDTNDGDVVDLKVEKKFYECDDRVYKSFYQNKNLSINQKQKLVEIESILPHLKYLKIAKKAQLAMKNPTGPIANMITERKKELINERSMLIKEIRSKIESFNQKIKELIVERHQLTTELKLSELRLLVLHKEYQLLLTFEDRDLALQIRQQKCRSEQEEITGNMNEVKVKLDAKVDELTVWQNKLSQLHNELKNTLPENHPNNEILVKIFKKKIKRTNKNNNALNNNNNNNIGTAINNNNGGNNSDESNTNNTNGNNGNNNSNNINTTNNDEDDYVDEDEDESDDDDDEYEDIEDICPVGCEPLLYERIIDLREKRVYIDENISDINKVIDDYKKSYDRFKQREKQFIKDVQQADIEVRQFHLQKQAALNQINVVAPIKLSQIYAFEGSGIYTKPSDTSPMILTTTTTNTTATAATIAVASNHIVSHNNNDNNSNSASNNNHNNHNRSVTEENVSVEDLKAIAIKEILKDPMRRQLVENIEPETHVLFKKSALLRLDERIRELHEEYERSSLDLKELHKERVRLKKEREAKEEEILQLETKCTELQMLKFGRIIQLDDLEAGADRSKEQEAEEQIRQMEEIHRRDYVKLMKEIENLQEELAQATLKNTECLNKVAELTKEKLTLTRELNHSSTSIAEEILPAENLRDRQEKTRLTAYIKAQAKEIESLRSEIIVLKRKDIPPVSLSASLPLPPQESRTQSKSSENIVFPPIKDAQPKSR